MNRHNRLSGLVPLYALDALESPEQTELGAHLGTCGACQSELAANRLAGALLVPDGPAPVHLWARIDAAVEDRTSKADESASVKSLEGAHARVRRRLSWVSSTAVVAVSILMAVTLAQLKVIDDLSGGSRVDEAASAAADRPGTFAGEFRHDGIAVARVVFTLDGTGYVLPTESLEPLPGDRTYQLWVITPGDLAISAGVLGSEPGPSSFTWDGDIAGFALTREVAGGVVTSGGDVVSVVYTPEAR